MSAIADALLFHALPFHTRRRRLRHYRRPILSGVELRMHIDIVMPWRRESLQVCCEFQLPVARAGQQRERRQLTGDELDDDEQHRRQLERAYSPAMHLQQISCRRFSIVNRAHMQESGQRVVRMRLSSVVRFFTRAA